ncbi:Iron/ascorbate family oxidoreductase [Handroanthus impetiginosus]|uniref:gibberellin 3beta-dioxygenase n=1 Tax=Handroanthus impetiginosus TaxID=429701 RepID=A0A2G9GWG9_9LAMI|nr:Iron/ascorbate family oxidoreductase [Handroanthus impetiginosus]
MPSRAVFSDAFESHPLNLHHKFLDLNSVKELPETHAWTSQLDDYPFSGDANICYPESVPMIDLNNENATELIGHACKSWGIFQVINHKISKNLLDEVELAGNRLFSLPTHQKLRAARPADGVSGYGVARISSFFPKHMWSEGFTIVGSPLEHARQLWPDDYKKFCDTIEEYQKEMKKLAGQLMWLMLGSLGITEDDLKWASTQEVGSVSGSAALQLNSYPACPDPDRAMGLAAHTDSTILTILHHSNTSGLQVLREGSNRWVTVPPHPGALAIHVGDLMHILSNGLYPSVLHRAVVNRTRHRLSIAYLYGPPSSVKISPLSKLVDKFHPPLYRPITWSEYLGTKAKHFDKALTSVRLCAPRNGFFDKNDHSSVQVG